MTATAVGGAGGRGRRGGGPPSASGRFRADGGPSGGGAGVQPQGPRQAPGGDRAHHEEHPERVYKPLREPIVMHLVAKHNRGDGSQPLNNPWVQLAVRRIIDGAAK